MRIRYRLAPPLGYVARFIGIALPRLPDEEYDRMLDAARERMRARARVGGLDRAERFFLGMGLFLDALLGSDDEPPPGEVN